MQQLKLFYVQLKAPVTDVQDSNKCKVLETVNFNIDFLPDNVNPASLYNSEV